MYSFDLPTHHKSIIKVVGVGGGGGNAVNHMYNSGIKDVEFVVCNTDIQALESSPVPNRIQLGASLTGGLGAGANPEKGRNAALESKEDIREMLAEDTRMVFITAGMGGGTGTGAAPVIAQVAKEMDILTVGIVTAPFAFEGKKKMNQANEGIAALKEHCDTVLVILNDKLREIFGNLAIREAFAQADNVLTTAAKGIAEIITVPGYVNVDFEDVKTVMKNAGAAVMGSAQTYGESRARRAAEEALNSPLLNNQNITGAQKILLSIMSGEEAELQMDELAEVTDYMQEFAGDDAEVIFGHGVDAELGENIKVTVIATGFAHEEIKPIAKKSTPESVERKKVFDLENPRQIRLFNAAEDRLEEDEEDEIDLPKEDNREEENERPFTFDFLKDEIKRAVEREDQMEEDEDSDFDFEFEEEEEEDSVFERPKMEERKDPIDLSKLTSMDVHSKKVQLMEERRKREELLNGSQKTDISAQDYKNKFDVPAYERKKINFVQVPHSADRNISKFNLTEDNQILGNNKYLHDNVD
ncbi:cell division protein FtsZ [Marinoscillum sp. MHG1-6]|uniref:cell division protein FtsZ n=1 Tax=Marinoscillum sp. MHG1-6 TaxID=2959627 RepID=UPI0021572EE3|nr:cell division protein FtsZ [Marinoscillum sp. MHG1-6]